MPDLLIAGTIIITASALLQGLSGFGFSILSLPLLAVFLSPKTAVPMLLIFSIVINLIVIASCWRRFKLKNIWIFLAGGIIGLPLGTKLLLILDDNILRKGIGVFLVVFSLLLLTGKRWKLRKEKLSQIFIGVLSGIFSGSVSISGPPIIVFLSNKDVDKDEFRASLSGYFFLLNLFTIPVYYMNGLFTHEVLKLSLELSPGLLAGVLLGSIIAGKITSERFGHIVQILLLLTGILSIIK